MTKNKTIKSAAVKRAPPGRKARNKNYLKKGKKGIGQELISLENRKSSILRLLINNPCGEIPREIASVTGTGLVRVIRTTVTLHTSSSANSGYLVWFPSYHGRGCQISGVAANLPTNGNVFAYESTTAAGQPTTASLVTPLWTGTTPLSAYGCTFTDPAYGILGTTFRDAATLAACMKFRYVGPTSANSGVIGSIENIDVASFINTDGTNTFGPQIGSLSTYAETRDRPQMVANEVKWAPSNGAGTSFRSTGDNGGNNTLSNATDTLVRVGLTAVNFTQLSENAPSSNVGIGFVWSGLNTAQATDIEIEFIKVVQLRLSPISGMRESETIVPTSELFTRATQALDSMNPSWRTTAGDMATHAFNAAASGLSNAALGGLASYARRGRMLMDM